MPTSAFSQTTASGVTLWAGSPDCQAAHDHVLAWLRERYSEFPQAPSELSNTLKGNLSEAISFIVAKGDTHKDFHAFPANALDPFSGIARSKIDIVWIFFAENQSDDHAFVQEIKATSDPTLAYADQLLVDSDKLFGTDLRFTLRSRLDDIKYQVVHTVLRPDLAPRINALGGRSPKKSTGVTLQPTLVHERIGADPATKMLAIRTTLLGRGWDTTAVQPWSIALSDLDLRLLRLARGLN